MMREENEKNETKQKNIVKKAKKIRSMVMMTLLCVLMLSAATYAWFTLSKTAKVSNLTMTVGDVTGLQISNDGHTWSGELKLDSITAKLMPATYVEITEGGSSKWVFHEPVYNDAGQITGIKPLADGTGKIVYGASNNPNSGYYCEKTFYMQSLGKDADIYLAKGEGLDETTRIYTGTTTGTYIELNGTKENRESYLAPAAVRVSFKVGSNAPVVYAPFNDVQDENGTAAEYADDAVYGINTNSTSRPSIVASQNSNGKYNNGGTDKNGDKSKILFRLTGNQPTQITMCVWIEGDDAQCVNEIQLENLIGQLVFESVPVTGG